MDITGALLSGPRAQRAFALKVCLASGWRLRICDRAALCLLVPVRGSLCVRFDDGEELRVEAGEVAMVRGPEPYDAYDVAGAEQLAVIEPDGRCYSPEGTLLRDQLSLGVRTWGDDPDGGSVFLTATYAETNEVGARLLEALPRTLVVDAGRLDWPVVDMLHGEVVRDAPGQEVVIDRLLDLLLMGVLRAWSTDGAGAPAWAGATDDAMVRRVLAAMHHHPAQPWTVASLARFAGVSRAVLARRFADAVGEPPMAYLTRWRIQLAADLLVDGGDTLQRVAGEVGYASPFGLSAAFKRVKGVSPAQYRTRVREERIGAGAP
ncbi:AraC family transcriptional regulator [Luteipulveratus flavus]|uniref:AraC family transcriptional regulator n=1 Tax=Luteipulveratus flavus TaxID=3031728 RepID=A0ABT6C8U1_9MICO|nr:AraC family transcriptional regulator [Luteipulveratus sp. YIM 133296]MDF8263711.1 AraC family transcriptional regulator [Luteipulveratus sp. YIM 133296]